MKKIIAVLAVAAVLGGYIAVRDTVAKPPAIQTVSGTVESVAINPDKMKGNKSRLRIISDDKRELEFEVNTGIGVICGSSDKSVSLRQVKEGELVYVEFMVKSDGILKATKVELTGRFE